MRIAGRSSLDASRSWSTARDSRACRASGKSFDNCGRSGQSLAYLGNQGGEFGERYGRQIAERCGRYAIERARNEVDHRLVRHRAFDLVAVRRERRQALGLRVVRDLAQQAALADTRLAFDQDSVASAGGEPRDESDEQAILVAAADEGCGIARGTDG